MENTNDVIRRRAGGDLKRQPSILSMRAALSKKQYIFIATCSFIVILLVWIGVTEGELVAPVFLPSPLAVVARLFELSLNGTLASDFLISFYRIGLGFLIASVMALMIGTLIGSYAFWEAVFEPVIDFIRYMPVVAFVPLTIVWTGTTDVQKLTIIWIGTFFQQALMFMDNVKRVPRDYINVGRMLGMSEFKILRRIVLRAAMPSIWDSLRVSLGWAWTWVVLAELVAATSGLGYRITVSLRYFQTDTAIGYILVLGLLGLATDQSMKAIGKWLFDREKDKA